MIDHRSGSLKQPVTWRNEIVIVPYSGQQILDFGFNFADVAFRPMRFVERVVRDEGAGRVERVLLPMTGEEERDAALEGTEHTDDIAYAINADRALQPFLGDWIPVPVLRTKSELGPDGARRFDPGPTAWARMRCVALDAPDALTGHTHRVQLALETMLVAETGDGPYVAPERADALRPREFAFVHHPDQIDWFLRSARKDESGAIVDPQRWVSDWLDDVFLRFRQAEKPGRTVTRESFAYSFEHWARYLTYLRFIATAVRMPVIRLANTLSARDGAVPVDVDLVLDVGNSRTCGILIERFPSESRIDLARSFPLEIRDLSRPELHYSGLIPSRVEFAELRFGDDRLANSSGRRNAFMWPSMVRVGPEALRLIEGEEGTETASGLSSPKRYLWDDAPMQQDWRFHDHFDPNALPRTGRAMMMRLNEAGDVRDQIDHEVRARLRPRGKTSTTPAIRPRFSRSSLFCFMLAELFAHALVQVNDPASRARRPQSDLPRRLSRIILTLPSATSAQEQSILRSRAEGALKLVWSMMAIGDADSSISRMPDLIVDWDEASCTQLVYLYNEINQKFEGRIDAFLELKGRLRPDPRLAAPSPSLRLACIDIGGGTTDLMISTYRSEDNRVLHPTQEFREGFRVAGDDLVHNVISTIILPLLEDSIAAAGGRHAREKLKELFGGDIGGRDQQQVQRRRQFGLRVLMPLAQALLEQCEADDTADEVSVSVAQALGWVVPSTGEAAADMPDRRALDGVLRYIDGAARELGAQDWSVASVVLRTTRETVDAVLREVFQAALGNMCRMIAHLGCDVVLLTGRPSRLGAVRGIIEELMVVPPARLISMHSYRTGRWYPFRNPVTQRIGDPKSTVAVGGMLIALAQSRIPNFKLSTDAFRMTSTARFVGEMDLSGKIPRNRVLFADVDLDRRKGAGDASASVRMHAPMHIGARQLPLESWTTTPMFRLDFASEGAKRRPRPLRVTLEKADFEDDEALTSEDVLRREALREAFRITEVVDAEGDSLKPGEIELRLHTLGLDDSYWIDSGVFRF